METHEELGKDDVPGVGDSVEDPRGMTQHSDVVSVSHTRQGHIELAVCERILHQIQPHSLQRQSLQISLVDVEKCEC